MTESNQETIVIEEVGIIPDTRVFFLMNCTIYVRMRNRTSQAILIEKVECQLEVDEGFEGFSPSVTPFIRLEPGYLSLSVPIEFIADISLKNSNYFKLAVTYNNSERRTLIHNPRKYITFYPQGSGEKQFFISYKDPEDSEIARGLDRLLKKLGFKGYISEDDHRPGLKLWEQKIPMAISSSIGIVILWTANAAQQPENIIREIEIAKKADKRLFMAPEQDVEVPPVFPTEIEYYRFAKPISQTELRNFALSIDATYKTTG